MVEVFGFLIIVLVWILIFFISGAINERKMLKSYKEKLITEYGSNNKREYKNEEFSHINAYYKKHKSGYYLDDITWNDLNMDDIYKQMDYAKSSAGDEYLYYLLRTPKTEMSDWTDYEEKVSYFMTHEKERVALQLALHKMGRTGKYSIYDYLDNLEGLGKRSSIKSIVADIILVASIILMFINLSWGLVIFFITLLFNVKEYLSKKGEIDPYITSFRYLFRVLDEVDELKKLKTPVIGHEIKELSALKERFANFMRFSYLLMSPGRMSGDMMEIGLDYVRMIFHLDIIKFNSMLEHVCAHKREIDRMLTIIGHLDVLLCVGEYRTYLEEYSIPEYKAGAYQAEALYHPLLQQPVKNDVNVMKSMLITGSNASGKSTFLKTLALNAVLAQSIHTVCADSYIADYFRIYSSLTLKDNIFDGDSYYMAEIKSIKRIMDAYAKEGAPVLAFVDEVLRGTNTIERISASSVILQQMAGLNGFCFAATHDLELTEILKNYYENVHFEESIENNDIVFPYRLQKGKATSRNAIALLAIMGYDSAITNMARNQAQRFEINHKWEVLP
ncbi:MAG: hypothetical protein J6C63_05880 [Lachnospiraceae bacterium]|nr:hypothetical protein [Lachnospiraceae bacterium]